MWARPLFHLSHNALTLAGAVLTTSSAVTLLLFWAREIFGGGPSHPYAGILFLLVLPALFALGLVLMPLGVLLRRRRLRARGELPQVWPQIDLRQPVVQNGLALLGVATLANVLILGAASWRGVEYMDSTSFCGMACHSVMEPEYTAYLDSPHARVACVECHIGPGAGSFVQAKVSGVRQLAAMTFDTHARPIPTPVEHLRSTRDTCQGCHWAEKDHGDRLVAHTRFAEDEANTPATTVLMMKVGGPGRGGIHGAHLDPGARISYLTTDGRRTIPEVTVTDPQGVTRVYRSAPAPALAERAGAERRDMDCVDCHNRPAHAFELPERALDRALAEGRISPTLPSIKKKGVEALRAAYPDGEAAARGIARTLQAFYRVEHPAVYGQRQAEVEAAVQEVQAIHRRNVFPFMKVDWGTHPDHRGHEDSPGCFRCHDGSHTRADGRAIAQDCESCHAILAHEETDPEALSAFGIAVPAPPAAPETAGPGK